MALFETIAVATDGSDSVSRAVTVALAVADRFDAAVHTLSVVDAETDQPVVTTVHEGAPAAAISVCAEEIDTDLVTTGTRGRHGEDRFLLGSVAECVVRICPVPMLPVRQLAAFENDKAVDAV